MIDGGTFSDDVAFTEVRVKTIPMISTRALFNARMNNKRLNFQDWPRFEDSGVNNKVHPYDIRDV